MLYCEDFQQLRKQFDIEYCEKSLGNRGRNPERKLSRKLSRYLWLIPGVIPEGIFEGITGGIVGAMSERIAKKISGRLPREIPGDIPKKKNLTESQKSFRDGKWLYFPEKSLNEWKINLERNLLRNRKKKYEFQGNPYKHPRRHYRKNPKEFRNRY